MFKSIEHIFTELSLLMHFWIRKNASSFGVKVQGHGGSNMLENALFGIANGIS